MQIEFLQWVQNMSRRGEMPGGVLVPGARQWDDRLFLA
jgi:hypothetical protein